MVQILRCLLLFLFTSLAAVTRRTRLITFALRSLSIGVLLFIWCLGFLTPIATFVELNRLHVEQVIAISCSSEAQQIDHVVTGGIDRERSQLERSLVCKGQLQPCNVVVDADNHFGDTLI